MAQTHDQYILAKKSLSFFANTIKYQKLVPPNSRREGDRKNPKETFSLEPINRGKTGIIIFTKKIIQDSPRRGNI